MGAAAESSSGAAWASLSVSIGGAAEPDAPDHGEAPGCGAVCTAPDEGVSPWAVLDVDPAGPGEPAVLVPAMAGPLTPGMVAPPVVDCPVVPVPVGAVPAEFGTEPPDPSEPSVPEPLPPCVPAPGDHGVPAPDAGCDRR